MKPHTKKIAVFLLIILLIGNSKTYAEEPSKKVRQLSIPAFILANKIKSVEDYARWLSKNITYKPDQNQDIWTQPEETILKGSGDCEDIAFLTAAVLKELGYKPRVLATGINREAHVFCLFRKNGTYHIFDNVKYYNTEATSLKTIFEFLASKRDKKYLLELSLKPKAVRPLYVLR